MTTDAKIKEANEMIEKANQIKAEAEAEVRNLTEIAGGLTND